MLRSLISSLTIATSPLVGAHTTRWFQPIMELPRTAIHTFTCIIWAESRSTWEHPNLTDNNRWGSSGIFQIEQGTWAVWAARVGLHMKVWQASPYQQALGAASIWRHDGFAPWRWDGCV